MGHIKYQGSKFGRLSFQELAAFPCRLSVKGFTDCSFKTRACRGHRRRKGQRRYRKNDVSTASHVWGVLAASCCMILWQDRYAG